MCIGSLLHFVDIKYFTNFSACLIICPQTWVLWDVPLGSTTWYVQLFQVYVTDNQLDSHYSLTHIQLASCYSQAILEKTLATLKQQLGSLYKCNHHTARLILPYSYPLLLVGSRYSQAHLTSALPYSFPPSYCTTTKPYKTILTIKVEAPPLNIRGESLLIQNLGFYLHWCIVQLKASLA